MLRLFVFLFTGVFLLGMLTAGCRTTPLMTAPEPISQAPSPTETGMLPATRKASELNEATPAKLNRVTSSRPTRTLTPTLEPSPPPTATPTATATPSATPIGPCRGRIPDDDLLVVVTLTYGLSADFVPDDLVPLANALPVQVTMGYPSEIREVALGPLVTMIEAMQAEGLQPHIISAYRSFAAQAIAWDKWNERYPEHANIISAPPGFSEHQLGTVVDFGSPELAGIVGDEEIEFHTYFYKTSEGIWLAENAYRYGFTLSYPVEAFDISGFYYEPWHYRYVGVAMATVLHEEGISLTEFQLANNPEPCIP